jgi:RHS repeat-associated protein
VTGGVVTKYYYAGSQRIAMRDNGTLFFLLGDHLGSTSLVTFGNGNVVSETRYKAWGEVRYASGTTPTDYTYTGQMSYTEQFGLMFYNARWYDPYLNHFTQPDSIVPDPYNSQSYDRYAYALNNPIRYNDPTGHDVDCGIGNGYGPNCKKTSSFWLNEIRNNFSNVTVKNPKDWSAGELQTLFSALDESRVAFNGNHNTFKKAFGDLTFEIFDDIGGAAGDTDAASGYIRLTHQGFEDALKYRGSREWLVAHEMGHVFDKRWSGDWNWLFVSKSYPEKYLSNLFVTVLNGGQCGYLYDKGCAGPSWGGDYNPIGNTTDYGASSSTEDFAESFAATIVGDPMGLIDQSRENIIQVYISLYVSNFP